MLKKIVIIFTLVLLIASVSAINTELETGIKTTNYIPDYRDNAMITEFSYFQGFEGLANGEMPQGWTSVVIANNNYASVGASSSNAYEGNRSLRFLNFSDPEPTLIAITPAINNLSTRRVRLMAKGQVAGATLIIGTTDNNSGDIEFTPLETISLTTTYEQYQYRLEDANVDAQYVALKYGGTGANNVSLYVDNFFVEAVPTEAVINIAEDNINFGDVYLNRTGIATLTISNLGTADLEVDFSQPGTELSFTPSEATIEPFEIATITVLLTPEAEEEYSGSFTVNSNDPTNSQLTVTTTAYILPALPEGVAIIGAGRLINQGLPLEPYRNYSYSQSIYYASEIGIADQRIEQISWTYNGNSAWGPDELKIYMGMTDETEFSSNTSWLSPDEMTEVYDGTITVLDTLSLVDIELDVPFDYDNTRNLVVGVFHSAESYHSSSDEFFCTLTNVTRSMVYYSDTISPNPIDPPAASYMRNSYPNVKLQFGDAPNSGELAVYPVNIEYEMVAVDGSSSEKTITMRSIGLQDLLIESAPVLTGNDADQFTITTDNNSYPLTLPFGEMATIGVTFSPTSAGTKRASIQITGTDPREVHSSSLSGYAYSPDGNDEPVSATELTLPVDGITYAIMPAGDIDWYKITNMRVSDTLMVRVEPADDSNIDPKIWLYGPVANPEELATDSFIADGVDLEVALPADGDYYLRIAKANVEPNANGQTEREGRSDTGFYNLYADARYNYDFNAPLNLVAINQAGYVELNWVEPPYERYLIGYYVYRDNLVITENMIPIGTTTYEDATVVVGTEYNYHVVGMYEEPDGFSQPSNIVTITYFNAGEPLWGDDFEEHPDFTLDLPNWIQYDLDGGTTYSISDVEFENAGEPMSYIVFNPTSTVPSITDMVPKSGDKFLASFASTEGVNNDWIITPRITIGTTTVVSFYARSYTSDHGLEKFRVKMSLGGDQVEDFTFSLHQEDDYLEAPTAWTPYYFNVSELSGTDARFAVQCVSENAFILMIDDFRVDSTSDGVGNEDVETLPNLNTLSQNYPNPFNPETSISFSMQEAGDVSLEIYNIRGQKVKTLLNEHREAGQHSVVWNGTDDNNKRVSSGVYFYRMRKGRFSSTKKMILMK